MVLSGRIVILMTHPCFRVPRLSGWGWDEQCHLQYCRLIGTLLPVAVETIGIEQSRATTRFHRPLHAYINALGASGFVIDCMTEIATYKGGSPGPHAKAENFAIQEIPLFLGLRARRV